ncbi:hypothetical protein PGT21_017376 [Puccinia graminis f. sp. tritici]|uniref:Uncharacterized protein n=1 Tax=Puccinia graminis f. sp. tritici TaxID=56615 RepID=A0A5B0NDX8_PUCGR|nr:hypothetical protein PGT21_017376 [Puccinia graminis f. sp. tritici]
MALCTQVTTAGALGLRYGIQWDLGGHGVVGWICLFPSTTALKSIKQHSFWFVSKEKSGMRSGPAVADPSIGSMAF